MTAFNVVNRSRLAAGQAEDVSDVLANLDAIAAVLNGGIDNSNIATTAGILASKLAGYPTDATKILLGNGVWGPVTTSYTPAWGCTGTAPALGNGSLTGNYVQLGKFVQGSILLTVGSTSTFGTGLFTFTVPAAIVGPGSFPVGTASIFDFSAGQTYFQFASNYSANTITLASPAIPTAFSGQGVPITFATGDVIAVNFNYLAS